RPEREVEFRVPRRRLVALLVAMAVAFAGLVWRLADVQGVSAERYAVFGESQRLEARVLPADRGSILDRNGAELAISLRRRTVFADPSLVEDPAAAALALAPLLGLDEGELHEQLGAPDTEFVYLSRKVEDGVADAVVALGLPGVFLMDEPTRFLPSGPLAAPVLGEVGDDDIGLSGLELQYDEQLTGKPGELLVEKDVGGNDIADGTRLLEPPERGHNLVLTIDQVMQYETERVLAEQIVSSKARSGIAIVMDPRTGEILALANLEVAKKGAPPTPSFDNMAVTRVYEPGSVNKVVTISAAVEEGVVEGDTRLSVPDNYKVADVVFKDDEQHEPAYWSVDEIMAHSSNVGTIMIGQRLGKDRLTDYLDDFGLVDQTALDFPGEAVGILPEPDEWSGTSIATVPIGQGVAVTALQMLGAYNTIANGGTYVAPRLVRGVVEPSGKLRPTEVEKGHRVVSEETAAAVNRMLVGAVTSGTGTAAAVPNYSVAGKTGTAGKPRDNAPGYKDGAYVASFVGFMPASAPRLSAIVVLDEPTPIYGGLVSAPAFSRLAAAGARLFDIPPQPAGDAPLTSSADRDLAAGVPGRDLPVQAPSAGTLWRSPTRA
ncbi:MAG TPA: penicillin-binding protein 2, partial [Acidimicrobiales bacterium]|nr:penicillin-binding protein 2 [Acidimicrobiales bacterium]